MERLRTPQLIETSAILFAMSLLLSCVLGLVEGLTEFLPVSSTAHLLFVSSFLRLPQSDALALFTVVIQGGAAAAIVVVYWKKFLDWTLLKLLAVSLVPTCVIGLIGQHFLKRRSVHVFAGQVFVDVPFDDISPYSAILKILTFNELLNALRVRDE